MANFTKRLKVLDGRASLGVSDLLTVTVNGAPAPAGMTVDMRAGEVYWTDQGKLGDPGPWLFEGTHRTPAETAAIETPADIKRVEDFKADVSAVSGTIEDATWQAILAIVEELALMVPKTQPMIDLVAKVEAIKTKNPKV